jgi:hypothetical protein
LEIISSKTGCEQKLEKKTENMEISVGQSGNMDYRDRKLHEDGEPVRIPGKSSWKQSERN